MGNIYLFIFSINKFAEMLFCSVHNLKHTSLTSTLSYSIARSKAITYERVSKDCP